MQIDEKVLEIFQKLERTLNASLSEGVRERLIEDNYIEEHLDYLEGKDEMVDWEELRDRAAKELRYEKRLRRQWLDGPTPETRGYFHVKKPTIQETSGAAPWVTARADANSVHMAEAAEKYPGVRRFRDYILGDNWPLTKEQASSFLTSLAAAFFPFEWFEEWNIPFVKHYAAEVKGTYHIQEPGCRVDHRVSLYITPLHVTKRVRYASDETPLPADEEIDAQNVVSYISWESDTGEKVRRPYREGLPRPSIAEAGYSWIWPGSVLDSLRGLGERVAKQQYRWDAEDAIWFILTGEAPFVSPVLQNVHFSPGAKLRGIEKTPLPESDIPVFEERRIVEENRPSTASIVLTVEPWVPADLVKSTYRIKQLQLIGRERPSWERNLKVYIFVKDRQGEGVDLSTVHNLWNQEVRKDWRYKRKHGFWQAYELARQTVEDATFTNPRDISDW